MLMKLRHLPFVVAAAAAVVPAAAPAFAQAKIAKVKVRVATVDVDRCLFETEDGLRAKATLAKAKLRRETQVLVLEDQIKQMEQEIQKEMKALQAAGKTQPPPAVQQLLLDYQNAMQTYQATVKQVNAELAALEDQLFLPIEKKVKTIFQKIAEAQGFDMLVDRKSMPISLKPDLDLTEQVIREYNWGAKDAQPAPAAKPASTPPKGETTPKDDGPPVTTPAPAKKDAKPVPAL